MEARFLLTTYSSKFDSRVETTSDEEQTAHHKESAADAKGRTASDFLGSSGDFTPAHWLRGASFSPPPPARAARGRPLWEM